MKERVQCPCCGEEYSLDTVLQIPEDSIVITRERLRKVWDKIPFKNNFVHNEVEKELFGGEEC